MKITAIETIRSSERPTLLWVHIHTDEGLVGLGETSRGVAAVEEQIHALAPQLLGTDPLQVQRHNQALLNQYVGFASSGAEVRAASALDIALWDVFGQATGQPIYQLLGGASRERIRAYNTCAGYHYNTRNVQRRELAPWEPAPPREGPYDDQIAFTYSADELAHSLLEEGFTAMKIWPFDPFAVRTGGALIGQADIEIALQPFQKIRAAVGNKLEVMAEMHSLWNLPSAKAIARELEPYKPFWVEDPIKVSDIATLKDYQQSTRVPVCVSETVGTTAPFRDLLQAQAADIVMFDVAWCGGITEARKIAALAEAYQRPVAPHDCNGPVVWVASVHLTLHLPNTLVMETVRAYYSTWYRDLLTELPEVKAGYIHPLRTPGLGTRLQPDLTKRSGVTVRRSAA